jgi:hypothetical protein
MSNPEIPVGTSAESPDSPSRGPEASDSAATPDEPDRNETLAERRYRQQQEKVAAERPKNTEAEDEAIPPEVCDRAGTADDDETRHGEGPDDRGPPQDREEPALVGHFVPAHPDDDEIRNRFSYHPPRDEQAVQRHAQVSKMCLRMAFELRSLCPPGRNFSLVLTHLEDVRMRANAAIACDSVDTES